MDQLDASDWGWTSLGEAVVAVDDIVPNCDAVLDVGVLRANFEGWQMGKHQRGAHREAGTTTHKGQNRERRLVYLNALVD